MYHLKYSYLEFLDVVDFVQMFLTFSKHLHYTQPHKVVTVIQVCKCDEYGLMEGQMIQHRIKCMVLALLMMLCDLYHI